MILIGVTGSFGSGKTTVANFFKESGARVIDADKIVHRLYAEDKLIKKKVLKAFGEKVFKGGRIDRRKLAGEAFAERGALKKLCGIVYPETIKKIKKEAAKSKRAVNVLDAPMLIEAGLEDYVDYLVAVKADEKNRIKRCVNAGFTKNEVLKRAAFQIPLAKKIERADFVIDNNRSKGYTRKQVVRIWREVKDG